MRAIVSWMPGLSLRNSSPVVREDTNGRVSRKCTVGSFFAFFGLMVLPISAVAFFQVAFRVKSGVNGPRMSGMMCALSSLRDKMLAGCSGFH